MEAFVYEWTDEYNGMFYIGYHKGTIDDGYISSSKYFNKAYNANPELFTREIIAVGGVLEMFELEKEMLVKVNAAKNPRYYNRSNGKIRSAHLSADALIKQKEGIKAKWLDKASAEPRKKAISKSNTERWKDQDWANKCRKKMSDKMIERWKDQDWVESLNKTCIHCGKTMRSTGITRFHNDKCKDKM